MPARRIHALILASCLILSVSWSPDTGLAPALLAAPAADTFTVMSLNLAMQDDVERLVEGIRLAGGDTADVLVFQEVLKIGDQPSVADRIAAELGLQAAFRPSFSLGGDRSIGLATLSRVPIVDARALPLKKFSLLYRSRERSALRVTLDTPAGPLRTYNVHLDTRINGGDRVDQVAGIIEDIDSAPGGALVAGDFNTNDNLWLLHTIPLPFLGRQGNSLEHYMARHGLRSAFDGGATHDTLRMRLDWMFLKDMRATARAIHPTKVSDHHALLVSLLPTSQQ